MHIQGTKWALKKLSDFAHALTRSSAVRGRTTRDHARSAQGEGDFCGWTNIIFLWWWCSRCLWLIWWWRLWDCISDYNVVEVCVQMLRQLPTLRTWLILLPLLLLQLLCLLWQKMLIVRALSLGAVFEAVSQPHKPICTKRARVWWLTGLCWGDRGTNLLRQSDKLTPNFHRCR